MRAIDLRDLVLLAALWGASFLFMRVAAPAFGPIAMIELRVLFATLFLLPFVLKKKQLTTVRKYSKEMLVVGLLNSALPFCLFAYALLVLPAGFTAIINATAPMFGAAIAAIFLGQTLSANRTLGLAIGFGGVVSLISSKGQLNIDGSLLTTFAAISAAACYGIAANYSSRRLQGVPALAQAFGSQAAAAALLIIPALLTWPPQQPALTDWLNMLVLGIACTGIAYLLYFRLISNVGATGAVSVTYLIPAFAMIWGWLFIDETVSPMMLISCIVILLGTALATGFLSLKRLKPQITS